MTLGIDDTDHDEDTDIFLILLVTSVVYIMGMLKTLPVRRRLPREPYTIRHKPVSTIMRRVFEMSELNCLDVTRMRRGPFLKLCNILRTRGLLHDNLNTTIEEQLAMFMYTVGHAEVQRAVTNSFDRSGETVSRYVNQCIYAIGCLREDYIKPPSPNTPPEIMFRGHRFYPYFKDCIGAIDGTHVTATVSPDIVARFRGRKDHPTQNIIVAVNFDLSFSFVGAGWEGSANDMTILRSAISVSDGLKVPEGKYYLADAGYTTMRGFITPYRGVRYHLKEYSKNGPRNQQELFNHRHSSLRNVVERAIGIFKKRFRTLSVRSYFPYKTQVDMVLVCAILHNYIMHENPSGDEFVTGEYHDKDLPDLPPEPPTVAIQEIFEDYSQVISQKAQRDENREWQQKRDQIATQMWEDYSNTLRRV